MPDTEKNKEILLVNRFVYQNYQHTLVDIKIGSSEGVAKLKKNRADGEAEPEKETPQSGKRAKQS
nr:hypothetical protein [uncultured Bacteroides sp.]